MSFLTENLPKSLWVDGTEYQIHADFRAVLKYNEMIDIDSQRLEYIQECLQCVYITLPENLDEAIWQLNWFVSCGKVDARKRPANKILGINSNTPFDFGVDGELIYSAFRRRDVYGIDLHTIKYLHWWEFMAMLNDIPDNTQLSRVMEYRVIDTTSNHLSKEQKNYYQAMQRYYKIRMAPDKQDEELVKALKEGRDPLLLLSR